MGELGIVGIIMLMANGLVTYNGLHNRSFFNKFAFQVGPILSSREWVRLLSAGFLHVDWMHFGFNMITLYFFSAHLEYMLGVPQYLVLYMSALVGGNLFALLLHKNNHHYRAVGASGAVSGVVFAAIALFPGMKLGFLFLPIPIPSWLFGLMYVGYSIYGIRSQSDNIGHEAHLGGGIIGLVMAILMVPNAFEANQFTILLILGPSLIFLYFVLKENGLFKSTKRHTAVEQHDDIDDDFNSRRAAKQEEIDRILDKIGAKGMEHLTPQEKATLEEYNRR